jgi:steroid delta-isomerase-like uncharacterized protein
MTRLCQTALRCRWKKDGFESSTVYFPHKTRAMLAAMSEAIKNVARQWYGQVWNQRNEAAIDRLFHAQGKCYGFPGPTDVLIGPEAFKQIHRRFVGAFPDVHMEVEEILAEGDKLAIRWNAKMTHRGDHLGFPATGKPVELGGSSFMIVRDGQIVEGWNYMDLTAMFQQLQGK